MTQPAGRSGPPGTPPARETVPVPPVDITRQGNLLILSVSLPGLQPSDFRISLVGNRQVYIDGTVPYRNPVPKESLVLAERPYGPFSRRIDLPLPVDARGASLQFERGVLLARLPLQLERLPVHWQ